MSSTRIERQGQILTHISRPHNGPRTDSFTCALVPLGEEKGSMPHAFLSQQHPISRSDEGDRVSLTLHSCNFTSSIIFWLSSCYPFFRLMIFLCDVIPSHVTIFPLALWGHRLTQPLSGTTTTTLSPVKLNPLPNGACGYSGLSITSATPIHGQTNWSLQFFFITPKKCS